MTLLARATEIAFVCTWLVAAVAHIYASRYWLPMWAAGFRHKEEHQGYARKALVGYGVFILALLIGFGEGAIAEYWGGGWH